ncbi:HK97-gp10 family putative phage morphogenesis protein [Photorhabdus akhurstii]|uniref:HK97-gp10 family putative phage morphogenesis protein n=1 Tax=Photorhabdus akhurstii TaxID=171438 RepID=UPI0037040846
MIKVEVKGLAELGRKLQELDTELQTKILRTAGKEAMEVVKEDMQRHAGYDKNSPGPHMRDDIKIRSSKAKKYRDGVMITVAPTKKHRMKAIAQEFGTVKQIAAPFIRPALDYNRSAVLKTLTAEIRDALSSYSK